MDFGWKRGVLGIILLIAFIVALYLTFSPQKCLSLECFQSNLAGCTTATYVNEEVEASWKYEIKGSDMGMCEIEVTLLGAKEGSLELRQYEGNKMSCFYEKGLLVYPEKELDACHGELKENLQSVIIDKLYEYVVDNIGIINDELTQV